MFNSYALFSKNFQYHISAHMCVPTCVYVLAMGISGYGSETPLSASDLYLLHVERNDRKVRDMLQFTPYALSRVIYKVESIFVPVSLSLQTRTVQSHVPAKQSTFKMLAFYILWMLVLANHCEGAKIFVFPYTHIFNSRTFNMEKIAILLRDQGHEITMLVADHYKPKLDLHDVKLIRFHIDETEVNKGGVFDLQTAFAIIEHDPVIALRQMDDSDYLLSHSLFSDKETLMQLKNSNFSLYFFDPFNFGASTLLNEYLKVPSVGYWNHGIWNPWYVFRQPMFYSFIPNIPTGLSDHMNFWERLHNYEVDQSIQGWLDDKMDYIEGLRLKYLPEENIPHMKHAFERVSLMIAANAHFALDYPRPVMPHVKPISGLLWTPAKPLPKFFNDIVTTATHGVILLSFGTIVPHLEEEKAEMFARVFAKLPQKVIWRHDGKAPKSLGSNTYLVKWFPQNDLLAHPATKLFITHCGVSSMWETLYHAVPVVAIPLFWDQPQNARKLTDRVKVGVSLDYLTLTETKLENAIRKVLNEKSYKENAEKISLILQDTPMSGQEELLFWFNYTMRHNGSLHFHSQAAYSLNWYQYFLLDVIAYKVVVSCLLITAYVLPTVVLWKLMRSILKYFQQVN
ncbi:UDP-glucuronosyltransferase 1-2-like [Lingula anatina]|uniref:UDP-glucuronosyltransferase 1-2-like n=1 Tax=Lingula anatina TaxID=7574 RepID=A0A2R2MSL2_LINAN|nr:UDP-glucuronosyltransferase 1-2-like [Lingula anatina]|eukprot:XP_023933118.1 UDP-glucuronosyltransferase 1-2-like [Lingula anatina]